MTNGNSILPYMRQTPQDYYDKNYAPSPVTPTVEIPLTPATPAPVTIHPVVPDPNNEGGIWIGTIEPSNPGQGWLFFDTSKNVLYIYTDSKWEEVVSSTTGSLPEAPTDGGIYARQSSAWTSTYDGGAY